MRRLITVPTAFLVASILVLFSSQSRAEELWQWSSDSTVRIGQGYEFKWSSPNLTAAPGQEADLKRWQKLLQQQTEDWANEFSQEAELAFAEAEKEGYKLNPWSSDGDFSVVWSDSKTLVVRWSGYDYRGGAHGLPFLEVQVLSLDSPTKLHPSSYLFNQDRGALEEISKLARVELAKVLAEDSGLDDWALKGSAPKWDNFRVLYPVLEDGKAAFEVIFPSYQVTSYAGGTPTVSLDFEKLAPWAKNLGKR